MNKQQIDLEYDRALGFGRRVLTDDMAFPPLAIGCKGISRRLFIGMRPMDDEEAGAEKDLSFSLSAVAVRYWGATDLFLLFDVWFLQPDEDDEPIDPKTIVPSEDPRRKEAIFVHHFGRDGTMGCRYQPYTRKQGRKPHFEPVQTMPEAGETQGRMVDTFGAVMKMTPAEFDQMMSSSPMAGTSPADLLKAMDHDGYMVLEKDESLGSKW